MIKLKNDPLISAAAQLYGDSFRPENISTDQNWRKLARDMAVDIRSHKVLHGAEIFLIDYDPQNPDSLEVTSWPGERSTKDKLDAVTKTVAGSLKLLAASGTDKELARRHRENGRGHFPAMLVCPTNPDVQSFYLRSEGGIYWPPILPIKDGGVKEQLLLAELFAQQIMALKKPVPLKTAEDFTLYAAIFDAYSDTVKYVAAYVERVRGNSAYWNVFPHPNHNTLASIRLTEDNFSCTMRAALAIPDLNRQILDGKIPADFIRGVFRELIMHQNPIALDYYHEMSSKEPGGLRLNENQIIRLLPFGRDRELVKRLKQAEFIALIEKLRPGQKPSDFLLDQLMQDMNDRAKEDLNAKFLEELRDYEAGNKPPGALSDIFERYIGRDVAMPDEVPKAARDDFIKQIEGINIASIVALPPLDRNPVILKMLNGSKCNFRSKNDALPQDVPVEKVAALHLLNVFDDFCAIQNDTSRHALLYFMSLLGKHLSDEDKAKHVKDGVVQLSLFIPEGSSKTVEQLAEEVGIIRAVKEAVRPLLEKGDGSFTNNPDEILRAIGVKNTTPVTSPSPEPKLSSHKRPKMKPKEPGGR